MTPKHRKRRRVNLFRVLLLLMAGILLFVIVFAALLNLSAPVITPGNYDLPQTEEPAPVEYYDPVYKHTYSYENFTMNNGVLSYEDENYRSQLGIDVSAHQTAIDWNAVAADGVEFAFVRAGYRGYETGELHEDDCFRANIEGAQAAGIETGVYFYSQAMNEEEAIEEAQFVLHLISDYDIDGTIVFDMEISTDHDRIIHMNRDEKTNAALAFARTIREAGYVPMIYGSASWLINDFKMENLQDECRFWVANYHSLELPYEYEFDIWQYTNKGSVPGIEGDVDINIRMVKKN